VVVNLCKDALVKRFCQMGAAAFDPLYFVRENGIVSKGERCLVAGSGVDGPAAPETFTGSTEFFFLAAALLRVGLFPGLRAEQELHQKDSPLFDRLRAMADQSHESQDSGRPSPQYSEQSKASVDALLGWEAMLKDWDYATYFSITQLSWLAEVAATNLPTANSRGTTVPVCTIIPEWFCKLPAEWLAFVATHVPKSIDQAKGEKMVSVATKLLHHAGTETEGLGFSHQAMVELIRIPGAFIRAGIGRARNRALSSKLRNVPRQQRQKEAENFLIDDRQLDIYSSFDRNDLGVTAFTDSYVLSNLGSTLLSTYSALDAVEGADVEKEHNFDKVRVVSWPRLQLSCHL